MSFTTFTGTSDPSATGYGTMPPPPPPPPVPNQVPAIKINTSSTPMSKRPTSNNSNSFEPPAAIQNVMMTKDKKPFTYTPGMGGKLDISQIKSPRMARRIAKNANDEGIEGPPKSNMEPKPPSDGNIYVQPQVAIPVFPMNAMPQLPANRTIPKDSPINYQGSERRSQPAVTTNTPRLDLKNCSVSPVSVPSPPTMTMPESPTTVVQLTKAPTPWMQNRNRSQDEQPEWAKRSSSDKPWTSPPDTPNESPPACIQVKPVMVQQQSSRVESPISSPACIQVKPVPIQQIETNSPAFIQVRPGSQVSAPASIQVRPVQNRSRQQTPQTPPTPQYRDEGLQQDFQPSSYQPRLEYENNEPRKIQQQQQYLPNSELRKSSRPQERVIPVKIEDRPSVFGARHESGHHQLKQNPNTQQRWGPPSPPVQQQQQPSNATRIIPIMVEDNDKRNNQQRGQISPQQYEPMSPTTPVQSRSFRVLQKITDTDSLLDNESPQMRTLQLEEDDKNLMNKFKEQVDGDTYLHQEEDPRYRGAAIPSKAFRFLQNMMDGNDSTTSTTPNTGGGRQNRNSKNFVSVGTEKQQVTRPTTSNRRNNDEDNEFNNAISPIYEEDYEIDKSDESIEVTHCQPTNYPNKNEIRIPNYTYMDSSDSDTETETTESETKSTPDHSNDTKNLSSTSSSSLDYSTSSTYDEYVNTNNPNVSQTNQDERLMKSNDKDLSEQVETENAVRVSLPLRVLFSVSEDNEDVATVIVGDTAIKNDEKLCDAEIKSSVMEPVVPRIYSKDKKPNRFIKANKLREETDDDEEDSGITSDTSRIASEIDTDSEYFVAKKIHNEYQRTKTHSRLFKLLNENSSNNYQEEISTSDAILNESYRGEDNKIQLLKKRSKSSPISMLPVEILNQRIICGKYKTNILCPRTKSYKNLPQSLKNLTVNNVGYVDL